MGSCVVLLIHLIQRNFCWVFFPMRVSQDKSLCYFVWFPTYLYFSDPFAYGYVVMMLNVIRCGITIKNLTWYQIYPERSLLAAETILQLQLLKIRVLGLKTLEDKN